MKMLKYFFLLQVLLAGELCCAKLFPMESHFRGAEYLEISDNEKPVPVYPSAPVEGYVKQSLDHFDSQVKAVWYQRYFVNYEHYRPGGPVFLMIDTFKYDDPTTMLRGGAWIEYAKYLGAMCVYVNHRYYGMNNPTVDASTDNLQYLNSKQALADAAILIAHVNAKYRLPEDVKWIAFGGGYSGSLAAWLRLKYPHLVHGAVASSAPFKPEPFFYDFYKVTEERLSNYSTECVSGIKDAFAELDKLTQDVTDDGPLELNEKFHFCETGTHIFSHVDLANYKKNFANFLPWVSVNYTCAIMTNKTLGSPIERYVNLASKFGVPTCMTAYFYEILSLQQIEWSSDGVSTGERQWQYQLCTEFGLFPVSSPVFGNISFDAAFFIQKCIDTFGPQYGYKLFDGIADSYLTYGGTDLNVRNVVFVQGSDDPWYSAGITKNISSEAPVIVIKGETHRADMLPDYSAESPEVKAAKAQIVTYIETWLK